MSLWVACERFPQRRETTSFGNLFLMQPGWMIPAENLFLVKSSLLSALLLNAPALHRMCSLIEDVLILSRMNLGASEKTHRVTIVIPITEEERPPLQPNQELDGDGGRYRIRTYDFHRVKMALYR